MIITQTVGQMTDDLPSTTVATQTPLPRTYLSFASLATKTNSPSDTKFSSFEKQMLENELLLQTQRNALKMVDSKLHENRYNDRAGCKKKSLDDPMTKDVQRDQKFSSVPRDVAQHFKMDKIAMKMVENNSFPRPIYLLKKFLHSLKRIFVLTFISAREYNSKRNFCVLG